MTHNRKFRGSEQYVVILYVNMKSPKPEKRAGNKGIKTGECLKHVSRVFRGTENIQKRKKATTDWVETEQIRTMIIKLLSEILK